MRPRVRSPASPRVFLHFFSPGSFFCPPHSPFKTLRMRLSQVGELLDLSWPGGLVTPSDDSHVATRRRVCKPKVWVSRLASPFVLPGTIFKGKRFQKEIDIPSQWGFRSPPHQQPVRNERTNEQMNK
uniref:Uncharacterized protein n=1 Tax=Rousettus aegyptiacus TaxID=9407 RepID=A0A7J8H0F0_ROUAE|nr:hypothetical protein HJG63_011159 [Rousettus aegyptiacus]